MPVPNIGDIPANAQLGHDYLAEGAARISSGIYANRNAETHLIGCLYWSTDTNVLLRATDDIGNWQVIFDINHQHSSYSILGHIHSESDITNLSIDLNTLRTNNQDLTDDVAKLKLQLIELRQILVSHGIFEVLSVLESI